MRPIAPRTGAPEHTIAENQPEYLTITVAIYEYANGVVGFCSRWQPSATERQAILDGADIFVMQLGLKSAMTPLMVQVGPQGLQQPGVPE